MTKGQVMAELNVALKQQGEKSVMFNEERVVAHAKGLLHVCCEAKVWKETKAMADIVWNDFVRRLPYCIEKMPLPTASQPKGEK